MTTFDEQAAVERVAEAIAEVVMDYTPRTMEDQLRDMARAAISAMPAPEAVPLEMVLDNIRAERQRQNWKWGVQRHSWPEWIAILTEEVGEAAKEAVNEHWQPTGETARLREELVHVAAVAVQVIEHIDECAAVAAAKGEN